jgi:hypothetical protein
MDKTREICTVYQNGVGIADATFRYEQANGQ